VGPFLVVFMVLQKFKTSTELDKMASIETDSKFTRILSSDCLIHI